MKRKDLDQEVVTRFVRFCPVDWYCWPCMRVELYGAPLNINGKEALKRQSIVLHATQKRVHLKLVNDKPIFVIQVLLIQFSF